MSREYSPYLETMLEKRGLLDEVERQRFLEPSYEQHLHSPWLLPDIDAAVDRIQAALAATEQICIFSDYDADGIPGAVIWHDFFTAIGYEHFSNKIPHRHYDGFGLNVAAVEEMAAAGATLIITVDCGTSDVAAVTKANALGIDVIITDHHQPAEVLPDAVAVVNPAVGNSYPFSGICGAAVTFKLVQALLERGQFTLPEGTEKWWLDMVGLATIADMVPLVDENRVFAHYGLVVLRQSRRPGLQQLLKKQRASQPHLTEDDIGFTIGPRINAASRMDTPEAAFMMLASTDEGEAGSYVARLEELNQERKTMVASMTRAAHERLQTQVEIPSVLVLGDVSWRPSLAGLLANKLAEEHSCPVFVWGRDGNGVVKGSCRAGGNISVIRLMEAAADSFLEFGGHHASGGFSVTDDKIHSLQKALVQARQQLGDKAAVPQVREPEYEFRLDEITTQIIAEQARLAPFGMANPKPLYLITHVVPTEVTLFGKTKEHTKLVFNTRGSAKEAIAFFTTPESFSTLPTVGHECSLFAHLEQSFFMGRLQTRLRIVDVR